MADVHRRALPPAEGDRDDHAASVLDELIAQHDRVEIFPESLGWRVEETVRARRRADAPHGGLDSDPPISLHAARL